MKIINKKYLFFFLILLSAAFVITSCSDSEGNNQTRKEEESYVYIETEKLKAEEFTEYIVVIGTAKPKQSANLASEEGGKIKEFKKDKGSYASKGDVIVVLDNDVLKATMESSKAQYEKAESNFKMQEKIYKENVTSEMQYLNSKYERDAAKANYELIKSRYEKTYIRAPFSGVVDSKLIEEGEFAGPGQTIVSIVNLGVIKVEAGVPEKYVNRIKVGDSVKVVFRDLENAELGERVTYVGNTISSDNRTFPIEVQINNSSKKIKPELSAEVKIIKEHYDSAVIIPEELITKTDLGYVVFVEKDGKAQMRQIDVVSRYNNKAAVKSGLNEGDNLIVIGYQNLVDGENVKISN